MIEIGAGGGSIARINAIGIVQVGPESAGAAPGPACYGLNGTKPTVSDADLVLGYLDAHRFAGGTMRLDHSAAEYAIRSEIAEQLNLSTAAAAWTIHDVVNETMASAVRMHVSERGGDPSRLVVVAFGGAGPVHVCNLARKLRIGRILVPLRAGVLSALGLVLAPAAYDIARTRKTPLRGLDFRALADDVADMQAEIAAKLQEVANVSATFEVALGLGYIGQSYHVPVSVDGETIATLTVGKILARFADEYRGKYGYYYDDVPVELVTVHVTGVADTETHALPVLEMSGGDASSAWRTRREAYSARKGAQVSFGVYTRDRLKPGMTFEGPCLIEEESATTVVDVDARVTIDRYGSLDIAVGGTE
jgi:N-methylhydantoinase A